VSRQIVIVGGGAGGMGAAGGVKAVDPEAEVTLFTGFDDVAYSPCGIPYVHGKEIDSFERLFLSSKQAYVDAGIDIHYNAEVTGIDTSRKIVTVADAGEVPWDTLVLATGFNYADPGVPGGDLEGLYYVKNIREAIEWDKVLDTVRAAVVVEASPLGVEMVTALAHRGIETHLVDPSPWPMSEIADPDIMAPVEESWRELGVTTHFNTTLEAFVGEGRVRAVRTSDGEIDADLAVICTHKEPNTALGVAAGLKTGSTGGFIVDERMATSAAGVYAAGDCTEIPH
jgi:NADH oxidase (H2O2-forming)